MKTLIYQIIYSPAINKLIRNTLKTFFSTWPVSKKFPISGIASINIDNYALKIATNPTSFATRVIYWEGLKNFEYVPIFKSIIPKISNFIDIGANTGLYSTLGGILNKKLMSFAFEPSKGPYNYLLKNIDINNLNQNIKPFKIALSNQVGNAEFHEVANLKYTFLKDNLGGVGNLNKKVSHRYMTTSIVEVNLLDNVLQNEELTGITLVKIDTEATENLVLGGMDAFIKQHRPIIICETLFNRIEGEIEAIIKKYDYRMYKHIQGENKLIETKTLERTNDDGVRDCFFLYEEHLLLFDEFISS